MCRSLPALPSAARTCTLAGRCLASSMKSAKKRAVGSGAVSASDLRALLRRAQDRLAGERTRLAKELHHNFIQQLTVLRLELAFLASGLRSGKEWSPRIKELETTVDSMIREMRRLQGELRPKILDEFGIVAALEWEASQFRQRTAIGCRLTSMTAERFAMKPSLGWEVYRLFQKVLAGLQGCRPKSIAIELGLEANDFLVKVSGGASLLVIDAPERRLDWLEVREHAAGLGGQFQCDRTPRKGMLLTLRVPLARARTIGSGTDASNEL
jgi:two-component system sensor histidine kinase UhpB